MDIGDASIDWSVYLSYNRLRISNLGASRNTHYRRWPFIQICFLFGLELVLHFFLLLSILPSFFLRLIRIIKLLKEFVFLLQLLINSLQQLIIVTLQLQRPFQIMNFSVIHMSQILIFIKKAGYLIVHLFKIEIHIIDQTFFIVLTL